MRNIIQDVVAVSSVAAIIFGVWFEFGMGFAAIIGGVILFACAIADARGGNTIDP